MTKKKCENAKHLASAAIKRMNKNITNEIFLIIQNDRDLMADYLRILANDKHGDNSVGSLNSQIGKAIKKAYHLNNEDMNGRENSPSCTLISSHQKFE